jgi:RNA-directed DNA polymerase
MALKSQQTGGASVGLPQPASPSSAFSPEKALKVRRYLHFDEPISPKKMLKLVADHAVVKRWQFMPVLRVERVTRKVKRKPGGELEKSPKTRPICYASHKDAALYEYYSWILNEKYELLIRDSGLDKSITAFRQGLGKCNIHFASEAFSEISARTECTVLAFDIKSFFDRLDHKLLKAMWCKALGLGKLPDDHFHLFKSVTKYAVVDRQKVYDRLKISKHNPRANGRKNICTTEEFRGVVRNEGFISTHPEAFGIPQGLPISALLSNIYLLNFDAAVFAFCTTINATYFRYCDDILIVAPTEQADGAKAFVEEEVKKSLLEIQVAKTTTHKFKGGELTVGKPLQYLGFTFDGKTVLLRNAGLTRYYSRVRAAVRLADNTRRANDKRKSTKTAIKTTKLNSKFSYLGHRTFLTYAFRASAIIKEGAIKGQVKAHWKKLQAEISKKETTYAAEY